MEADGAKEFLDNYAILSRMNGHIAIDIGGTQMRAAYYTSNRIEPIQIERINSYLPGVQPQERIIQVIESVWPSKGKVKGIGIAVAGPINLGTGHIQKSPNIPAFDNFPIVSFLKNKFNTPVLLGNDANLAALGEWKFGAGKGKKNLIYFTISTGIGSGVITDGKLLLGERGMAAELGHVTIFPNGPVCSCGQLGHLEAFSSGTSIAKWTASEIERGEKSILENTKTISAKTVAEAAYNGDPLALSAFERAGKALGIAIVNYLHIFNPSTIIFGGGVSKSFDLLSPFIDLAINTYVFAPGYTNNLSLKLAELGDDAGLLGALALVRESHK